MIFDILTLFPEAVNSFLSSSIIGRAREKGSLTVRTWNIRDFSKDKHKKVDDYPYGGGSGMVMTPQPIHDAWLHVTNGLTYKPKTIYLSPQGRVLTQDIARSLLQEEHIILLCGHYEGVDERILEEIVDEEISIGDYVLTGGELPAMVLVDCISRMVEGVLACEEAFSEESHYDGLLEYPQYSRPPEYLGKSVPDILLSGHHVNIQKWRFDKKLDRTREKRPDLYEKYRLSHPEEKKIKKSKRKKDNSTLETDIHHSFEQNDSDVKTDEHSKD